MDRVRLLAAIALVASLVGLIITFDADALATQWQSLGPGVWGGLTDPNTVMLYRVLGMMAVGFGLALTLVTANHWLRPPRQRR